MRQNFVAQFVQRLKSSLCDMQLGVVMKKNWALSVDQCPLQALQFSVQIIDMMRIILRCNGFEGIQRAIGNQTASRPPNSDHELFGASFALRHALEFFLNPITELAIARCHIKLTFSHISQSNQEMVHCCCTE